MNHCKEIAAKLKDFGLDAMLVTSAPGEFYAVGFHGEGTAVVTADKVYYFTDSRYIEAAEGAVTGADIAVTSREKPYKALVAEVVARHGIRTLGFEEGYMTVAQHGVFAGALPCELKPAQGLLTALRASKGPEELRRMVGAQRIAEQALDEILGFIRPGMTEREIAAKLIYDMLRFGAEKTSFDPIVVTGPNGSLPHGVPGTRPIETGCFITMDFGCVYEGYCSDMTRTVAVGKIDAEMERVYHTVLEAQLAGIAAARAGVTGAAIDAAAREVITRAGYGDYFGHGFGHSLGIEVHESPSASPAVETLMPAGAVISAEPGIYLPGRFGVRIEDVIVLREGGCEVITKAPKELITL